MKTEENINKEKPHLVPWPLLDTILGLVSIGHLQVDIP